MKKIFSLVLLLAFSSAFAEPIKVTFVTDEWENQTNANGTGSYFEAVKAAFEPEYKVEFKVLPWARAAKAFRSGEYDVLIAETKFEPGILKSKNHIDISDLTVFYKDGFKYDGVETLKKTEVSWVRGYGYENLIPFPVKFTEVDNADTALKMLAAGRANLVIDYEADFESNCKKAKADCSKIKFQNSGIIEKSYLAFKDNENGKKLKDHFDSKMDALIKSGAISTIYKKYGTEYK